MRPTICADFDGVLHSAVSPWVASDIAPDPPVPGAIEWLRNLLCDGRVAVAVHSCRSDSSMGILCMQAWLEAWGLERELVDHIEWPTDKPGATVYVDDRGWRFCGQFPSLDDLLDLRQWQR